jgi:hypothetical protein
LFFLTVKLLPRPRCIGARRRRLGAGDFAILAWCLYAVPRLIGAVRSRQRFLLTAWVFLPDHWHGIWREFSFQRRCAEKEKSTA